MVLLLVVGLGFGAAGNVCSPADLPMGPIKGGNAQIRAPATLDDVGVEAWLDRMRSFRAECQAAIGFNGSAFEVPQLKWTQSAFVGPQMHIYDRFFFNPDRGNGSSGQGYTVDRWLEDLNRRYGGIDRAVLWPVRAWERQTSLYFVPAAGNSPSSLFLRVYHASRRPTQISALMTGTSLS